jgi:hypothetical protein
MHLPECSDAIHRQNSHVHSERDMLTIRYHSEPRVILGPDEAFQATLLCIEEAMAAAEGGNSPSRGEWSTRQLAALRPHLSYAQRQRVLTAYLLYGPFG